MIRQLALNIRLSDGATFATYYAGPNEAAVHALQALTDPCSQTRQIYLWGSPGTGKSHLLQALCHQLSGLGHTSVYLPLAQFDASAERVLENLCRVHAVCIDDLDAVAGRPGWERGLFSLINGAREAGHRLLLASDANPAAIPFVLGDLKSRLTWGPVFHLKAPDDEAKLAALRARAGQCGLELKDEAGRFLLHNCRRDLGSLFNLLSRLDQASLAAQRRVTIPFIKSVLGL